MKPMGSLLPRYAVNHNAHTYLPIVHVYLHIVILCWALRLAQYRNYTSLPEIPKVEPPFLRL